VAPKTISFALSTSVTKWYITLHNIIILLCNDLGSKTWRAVIMSKCTEVINKLSCNKEHHLILHGQSNKYSNYHTFRRKFNSLTSTSEK
jgi:hypothetical protein